MIRTVLDMAKVKSTLKPQSVKLHHPSSIPIVWSHSTVNHTNIFGYHFHFVDCAVIIENRFLFLLSSKDNSIGGLRNNTCIYKFKDIPVDRYAHLSAECSIEGLERSIIQFIWCQHEIRLGIFYYYLVLYLTACTALLR